MDFWSLGSFTLTTTAVSSNAMFNYFWSIGMFAGFVAWTFGVFFRIISEAISS